MIRAKMAAEAGDAQLKKGIKEHLQETRDQITVLNKVFKSIGQKPSGEKCDAIEGLIKEAEGVLEEIESPSVRDAAIIGCCQAVEHYEIARYGTLREWAKVLGHDEAHTLLGAILDQEKAANNKLNNLAISESNEKSK